jgi:hypothetical protein
MRRANPMNREAGKGASGHGRSINPELLAGFFARATFAAI